MGLLSVGDRGVNENPLVVITELHASFLLLWKVEVITGAKAEQAMGRNLL